MASLDRASLLAGGSSLGAEAREPKKRATRRSKASVSVAVTAPVEVAEAPAMPPTLPGSAPDARERYLAFVASKSQEEGDGGFAPLWLPPALFDFQASLVDWSLRKGRAATFADCGLGKTPMQLAWAENVVRKTNRPVLILTPLAVGAQTIQEGEKFGVECRRAERGRVDGARVYVANYERLHHFSPDDFAAVVCDESSILKSFEGETKAAVTEFMRRHTYRALYTATAAPNDYVELGTSSDALGYLGFMDMLSRFFKNARNNASLGRAWSTSGGGAPQWRFRGHAEQPFWRWVCSWARALRKPSDLGFDDARFVLPPLVEREHVVRAAKPRAGLLFSMEAVGLQEEREERRRTMPERCEMAAALVRDTGQPAVMWCHLNPEGDLLAKLVPGAVQVSGRDSDAAKEEKFAAFSSGQVRVLVTKPVIGAWGLNWQHCAHMTTFGSHSFEQYYQSIRRSWRFGQTRPVTVDVVVSDGEARVLANLRRKAEQADAMMSNLTAYMARELGVSRGRSFNVEEEMPSWL